MIVKRGIIILTDSREQRNKKLSSFFLHGKRRGDKIFYIVAIGAAAYTLLMLALIMYAVGSGSEKIFSSEGFKFFTSTDWNSVEGRESFGALPYIIGTLISSAVALAIGVPLSLGIAIFLSEMSSSKILSKISTPLSFVIELLAAVPSIIYGLWALFVFRFWILNLIEMPLYNAFGKSIPFFGVTPFGLDWFTAGIVLAIMIIPIVSSICREVMRAVPDSQREAAYSLGATRWETVRIAIFPYAKSGILGAVLMGLGRAIGETMLVTLVIGNAIGASAIPTSLFSPSQTLSSLIANEFNEASSDLHLSALIGLGAVLLMITMAILIGARLLVSRMVKVSPGARE
ncbi:MAG: phosphate ABC transporter permease subunit PstC [Candidatus Nitrosopolaris sp.]|jgi:phosphate transport system permease protein